MRQAHRASASPRPERCQRPQPKPVRCSRKDFRLPNPPCTPRLRNPLSARARCPRHFRPKVVLSRLTRSPCLLPGPRGRCRLHHRMRAPQQRPPHLVKLQQPVFRAAASKFLNRRCLPLLTPCLPPEAAQNRFRHTSQPHPRQIRISRPRPCLPRLPLHRPQARIGLRAPTARRW
jgi:hypothetical protein